MLYKILYHHKFEIKLYRYIIVKWVGTSKKMYTDTQMQYSVDVFFFFYIFHLNKRLN